MLAYLGVGLLAAVGLYRNRSLILVWAGLAAAFGVLYQITGYSGPGDDTIGSMARFGPAFMIGAGFYAAREQIPLSAGYVGLALLAAFASQGTALGPVMLQIALAWLYLWAGFLDVPGRLHPALAAGHDGLRPDPGYRRQRPVRDHDHQRHCRRLGDAGDGREAGAGDETSSPSFSPRSRSFGCRRVDRGGSDLDFRRCLDVKDPITLLKNSVIGCRSRRAELARLVFK